MKYERALIVDDDPLFQVACEEILLALGVTSIEVASDGVSGLRKLEETGHALDLVVSDLQMPNLDGIAFIRELGRTNFSGALIVASGEDEELLKSVRSMAMMSGIRLLGCTRKPLDLSTMHRLLGSTLPNQSKDTLLSRTVVKTILENNQFGVHYQPKLNLRESTISGVEALIRISDGSQQTLNPATFVEATERFDLMPQLTNAVVDRVLRDSIEWRASGVSIDVALNFSPSLLGNVDLPDTLKDKVNSAGLKPEQITLEVTENVMVEYHVDVLEVLSRLKLMGFSLSMDDFGTGATGIEQLRLYPFDSLKIDKAFVLNSGVDPFSRTTVETGTKLAAMLGMDVTAEGVETEEQLKFVKNCGAAVAQGFYIARPMSLESLISWSRDQSSGQSWAA